MSLFFLYKPHCFFDLGLGTWKGDRNRKALTKEPMPETELPVITKDRVSKKDWDIKEQDEEEEMVMLLMF